MSSLTLVEALDGIRQLFDAESGRVLSPVPINVRTTPAPNLANTYSLLISNSRNLGTYRDTSVLRTSHTLVLGFMIELKMNDMHHSMLLGMDDEQRFIAVAGLQRDYQPIRLEWQNTKRTPTPTNEFVVVEITFEFTHDLSRMAQ